MSWDPVGRSEHLEEGDLHSDPGAVDTVCRALYALLVRASRDSDYGRYEDAIIRLANQAMTATPAFDPFILALDECLTNRDHAAAVLVGRAMVDQEAVLIAAAAGQTIRPNAQLQ